MGEWQPIETAPKGGAVLRGYSTGPKILGIYRSDSGDWCAYNIVSWNWHKNGKTGAWKSRNGVWIPTHWMPLPAPPVADAVLREAGE